ncbi:MULTISPECIES: hypothetical protein [Deefgea]|uniref:Uncharacterized protein n=1 Tax=Deefgea chitinilytica TaxID=570276 RepID=A0ABS2CCU4_9NEIS|nr:MULTISPECIES: hypothetical protein [Deefgea]MBM5571969.1 hypothetical protein [Deefgea chitinilytica]MBM9889204.1 hypothetical protein [Deefgea sp. CFH1-16]
MKTIKYMACVAILMLFIAGLLRAEVLETIALRHRLADQVLPVLQATFPQARIQAFYGTLIVAAPDAQSMTNIRQLLQQLDMPLQNLIVTVEQRSSNRDAQSGIEAQGRVILRNGDVDASGRITLQDQQSQVQRSSVQTLRLLDGAEGFIQLGQQRFIPQLSFIYRPDYSISHFGGVWQSAGTGFYVAPRRIGETGVTLQLMPQQRRFVGARGTEGQSVFSEVQGQLGEWLPIGETRQQQASNDSGLLSRSSGRLEQTYSVWVKVELPK